MSFLTSSLQKAKSLFKKKKTPISIDAPIEELLNRDRKVPKKITPPQEAETPSEEHVEEPTEAPTRVKSPSSSPFNDPSIPWFRRWFMFAFAYPTIISVMLKIVLG